jgi:diguanylate cyclase
MTTAVLPSSTTSIERATHKANKAIEWLVSHKVAPTREALSVALAYFEGVQEVCQALEGQAREGQPISVGVVLKIYEKHLSPNSASASEQLQDGLKNLLQSVVGEVQAASQSAQRQGDKLQESIAQIDASSGSEALRVVAMAMLEMAREAQESNQRLREGLHKADDEMLRLRTEMEHHRKESQVDPLTRLINRRGLEEMLGNADESVSRDFALLVLDLDEFKGVNDTYGHAVGDAVLRNVAAATQKCLLGFDKVVRLGGDEFLVILPGASSRDVADIAEKVRRAVEFLRLKRRSDGMVLKSVTASIGMAVQSPGESFDEVMLRADDAAYASKRAGRNRVTVSDSSACVSASVEGEDSDLESSNGLGA